MLVLRVMDHNSSNFCQVTDYVLFVCLSLSLSFSLFLSLSLSLSLWMNEWMNNFIITYFSHWCFVFMLRKMLQIPFLVPDKFWAAYKIGAHSKSWEICVFGDLNCIRRVISLSMKSLCGHEVSRRPVVLFPWWAVQNEVISSGLIFPLLRIDSPFLVE